MTYASPGPNSRRLERMTEAEAIQRVGPMTGFRAMVSRLVAQCESPATERPPRRAA
jgi:hypothetical protein